MESSGIKIGFTGSHGTGKTTISIAVANELGVTLIEERARMFSELGFDLNKKASLETQLLMLVDQVAAESGPFHTWVADRILIDYLAYIVCLDHTPSKQIQTMLENNIAWMMRGVHFSGRYDHIFLVPTGKITLLADILRPDDIYYQELIDSNIRFYLDKFGIPFHEIQSVTLTDRVQEVLEVIYP